MLREGVRVRILIEGKGYKQGALGTYQGGGSGGWYTVELDDGKGMVKVRGKDNMEAVPQSAPAPPSPPACREHVAATPTTETKSSRTASRLERLPVSEYSSLSELRDFIDREKLAISKGVGGRERRTKAQMFEDIRLLWDQKQSITAAYQAMDVDPGPCPGQNTGNEMVVHLPREMLLGPYLALVNRQLDGMAALLQKEKKRAKMENRLRGSVRDFQIDAPSACGLARSLGKTTRELALAMSKGEEAIQREFEEHGTPLDRHCLNYVVQGTAGSDAHEFWNGKMDGGRQEDYGLTLQGFLDKKEAVEAGLEKEEVIALRVYSTAAYKSLNDPFLARDRSSAHPFPATIGFLASGIKKLRSNDKSGATFDLFRGLSNVKAGEGSSFDENGGTMGAPMSTSRDLLTAVKYAASEQMLVLKIKTTNFRQRGADISFLSAFPEEKEILYPPGTFLQPTETKKYEMGGALVTVIEVTPDIE